MSEHLLRSWRDGAAREAITAFVARVAGDGPDHVPVEERVAVFDNDGTLWSEKPMPIQLDFTLRRLADMVDAEPALGTRQPWKAAHERDAAWFDGAVAKHYQGDDTDLQLLMSAIPQAFVGQTVEEFDASVAGFFRTADHPTLGRPYRHCTYLPMVELLRYLEANDFTTYIASGGDRDFMRPVAGELYGIPPERVIGSSLVVVYDDGEDSNNVLYKAEMEFFDDGPTKPVRIWSRIGRRPLVAVGNSNGDIEMLRFARSPTRPALRILLAHDDPEREFAYETGAERAVERARSKDWTTVSIKDDWTTVFGQP